jgi:dTDP-4-amino-4,6-dideoxygalactose transaminase
MYLKKFNSFNNEEVKAAIKVVKSGKLSGFIGEWCKEFYGGKYVREMEKKFAKFFGVKYAISVNSWTSGLVCALGALEIEPGDEVILPTWTMAACSSAILYWNAIPIFADINDKTLCIDPKSIQKNITKRTRAIMTVDIFGLGSNINEIKKIAKKNNLKVISDSAQAPFARYNGKIVGTISDIGGISLNYHKHIHTGEGGVLFTNNKKYAEKMQLIRNHAEAVLKKRKNFSLTNMIGNNFRLGEIEAAIAIVQLKKLKRITRNLIKKANYLTTKLSVIPGITLPETYNDNRNVFYCYPIILNNRKIKRAMLLKFLNNNKIPGFSAGYQNLHLMPMFQKKIAYGKNGFPWSKSLNTRNISYKKGICPIAELMHDKLFIGFSISQFTLSFREIDIIVEFFRKAIKYSLVK